VPLAPLRAAPSPTLVVCGTRQDAPEPYRTYAGEPLIACAEAVAEAVDGQLLRVPGHYPHTRQPATVNAALRRLWSWPVSPSPGRRSCRPPPESACPPFRHPTTVPTVDLFSRSWNALRTAVAELPDEDFSQPSGCTGWLVRDLVCHLVIDAQDVLITLVTPADTEPTRDAVTYWEVAGTPPTGDDPLDALTVRLAAAYQEPWLLKFHLDDVGSAAGRAAELADPTLRVATRDQVLTAGDYLSAYVLEWTLHHLDLTAHLPHVAGPPADGLARSRRMLERIAGAAFPASFSDRDALLVGTGRRTPTAEQRTELGDLAAKLPLVLG
jgi:hypothetical protein